MNAKAIVEQAARRAVAFQQATQLEAALRGDDNGVSYTVLATIIEREFDWVVGLIEALQTEVAYLAQREDENNRRAATQFGSEASWHSAKADTYRRAGERLAEIIAAIPKGEGESANAARALLGQEKTSSQSLWQNIATAPKDGTYILVAGDSGYTTTPLRVEVCRYDPEYRPLSPWINHADDCFEDGGDPPTHWMPLPSPPRSDGKNDDLYCWRCERLITNRTTITCPHCRAEIDEAGKCPPV